MAILALMRRYITIDIKNLEIFRQTSLHTATLVNNFFDIFKRGSPLNGFKDICNDTLPTVWKSCVTD